MPAFFTSLVGREKETGELANPLRRPDVRLLTLTGPGGIGKTRLSVRVALAMREFFADGVCFVALSSISNPERVFPAIAEALSLQEIMGQSVFDQVACALRDKDMLLLLDNFEQVIDAGFLLEDLLSACPALKLMITRREVEVLRLLAKGWTDAQIAEHLVISPRTVNRHTTSIYSKIAVSSRSAATRYALERKLA